MENKNLFLLVTFACLLSSGSLIAMKERAKSRGSQTPTGTKRKRFNEKKRKKKKSSKAENSKQFFKCHVCHDYIGDSDNALLPCKCGWTHSRCVRMVITRLENDIFENPYKPHFGEIIIEFRCSKCHKSWLSKGKMEDDKIIATEDDSVVSAEHAEKIRESQGWLYKLPQNGVGIKRD